MNKAHSNMFEYYHTYQDYYKKMIEHQERDGQSHKYWIWIAAAFYGAGVFVEDLRLLFWPIAAGSAVQALIFFIDMSNRNTMLHLIDYLEWRRNNPSSD